MDAAAAAPLRIRFVCTLDDFVDAHKVHRRPARRKRIGLGERLLFIWILLAAIAVILALAIAEGVYRRARGGPGPTVELLVTNWAIAMAVPWLPWLLIMGLLWFAASGVIGPNERRPTRQMLLVMAVVALLNAIVSAIASGGPSAPRPAEPPERDVPLIVSMLPWLTLFGVIWFYVFRYLRGMLPRHWDAQPHLRREQTMEQTDHGLRFDDGLCVRDYQWSGFTKFREGDGLFVLYISDVGYHMVPKRAFNAPGAIESFRRLLEQRVPTDGPIAGRFPIAAN
jgi:hypothetical protein